METKIVNIKSGARYDIYCGRANKWYGEPVDSTFCNPFVIGKDGSRQEVIEKFKQYAATNKTIMNELYLIDDKTLGCYCNYPEEDCHCRILIELRQKQIMGKATKYKLAVIGSRGINECDLIYKFLDDRIDKIEMIVSGGCKNSPDEIAHDWCKSRGKPILIFYPDWNGQGKSAGFKRNRNIIEAADKVVAFWNNSSKGTANSIEIAKELNKPYKIIISKAVND